MHPTEYDATHGADPLETAIDDRLVDIDSGRYETNVAGVLRKFSNWARDEHGIDAVADLNEQHCRAYARALARAVDDDAISPESARRYYAYVRAFCSWCVDEGLLDRNPATTNRAEAPLPNDSTGSDQQYWSRRERKAICTTAEAYVDAAGESDAIDRDLAHRNRALVYTLAYSGVRVAELAAVSDDDERNGLRWTDVDLADGVIDVFGKTREYQPTPLLEDAIEPLRQWRQRRNPGDDAFVFPRLDNAAKSMDPPPSISTQSVRDVLADLCVWSDYGFDEPLQPHGARRGLGRELYREQPQLAQEILRHQSIETTHESYAQEDAQRVRDQANAVLEDS